MSYTSENEEQILRCSQLCSVFRDFDFDVMENSNFSMTLKYDTRTETSVTNNLKLKNHVFIPFCTCSLKYRPF